MELGIDLGTTRTVVACVDRGNYPVVNFTDHLGDTVDHVPSVVALDGDTLVYGFDAMAAAEAGAPLLRSFKRTLADPTVSPSTTVTVGTREVPLLDVMTGFLVDLQTSLRTRSNLGPQLAELGIGRTVIAVPAHAPGAQRFLTLEAFRRAGFEVSAVVNEPSAAGFEYTHRQGRTLNSKRTRIVVYDLGGGTFDASLVRVDGTAHEVIDTIGRNRLGGDDFDLRLADLVLDEAGVTADSLGRRAYAELLDDCRDAKEHLSPQSKRITLEVRGEAVTVRVADFYEAAAPLVDDTLSTMSPLVSGLDDDTPLTTDIAGIYLVGGASSLPLIPRHLRERFGRRVHRSPYPGASTAIGLAIAADPTAGYSLTDRLSRGFGVFRDAEGGQLLQFDPILSRDELVGAKTRVVTRRYRAAHDVGWFRFVEYASVDADGQPTGDIVPFADVIFPFTPQLQSIDALPRNIAVQRLGHGPEVEERYEIDANGMVSLTITDLDTGYSMRRALGD
ncbi:Hsp70 family protein [Mariniluteicoccus endophyticus]